MFLCLVSPMGRRLLDSLESHQVKSLASHHAGVDVLKKSRKRKRSSLFRKVGAVPLRVTLWLTRSERDKLRQKARDLMPLTSRKLPRTGILLTEIVRDWWEKEGEK